MSLQLILTGLGLLASAGALIAALRYAHKLGRAEAEKERADADLEAKKRADGVRVVTRSTVTDRLRDGSF